MDQIVTLPPREQRTRDSLRTLGRIRHYVEVNRFSLGPLARGIMWEGTTAVLQDHLECLVEHGYMTRDKGAYEMTQKGLSYFHSDDADDDESGFHIEFHTHDTPPPAPARRDPRDRRR